MATRLAIGFHLLTDYTQAEEDTYAATLTGQGYGWATIFNTTTNSSRIWDGTIFINSVIASGTALGTGTPDATTFLRGDLTWATVTGGTGLTQMQSMILTSFKI